MAFNQANRVHPTTNLPAPNPSKQAKITGAISVGGNRRVSQRKVDKLVINLICEGLHPLSFVERPASKKLVVILNPQFILDPQSRKG